MAHLSHHHTYSGQHVHSGGKSNMSMSKHGKHGLWSIKWIRLTMLDEMNEMGFGLWIR